MPAGCQQVIVSAIPSPSPLLSTQRFFPLPSSSSLSGGTNSRRHAQRHRFFVHHVFFLEFLEGLLPRAGAGWQIAIVDQVLSALQVGIAQETVTVHCRRVE